MTTQAAYNIKAELDYLKCNQGIKKSNFHKEDMPEIFCRRCIEYSLLYRTPNQQKSISAERLFLAIKQPDQNVLFLFLSYREVK